MMGMKTIYNRMFLNFFFFFCISFIKHLIINVRKMLQMNILISE